MHVYFYISMCMCACVFVIYVYNVHWYKFTILLNTRVNLQKGIFCVLSLFFPCLRLSFHLHFHLSFSPSVNFTFDASHIYYVQIRRELWFLSKHIKHWRKLFPQANKVPIQMQCYSHSLFLFILFRSVSIYLSTYVSIVLFARSIASLSRVTR